MYILYLFIVVVAVLLVCVVSYLIRVNNQDSVNKIIGNRKIYYTYDKPISFKARIGQIKLRFINRIFVTYDYNNQRFNDQVTPIPENIKDKFNLEKSNVDGKDIFFLTSKDNKQPSKYLFYIHGGGYVYSIMPTHWEFMNSIIQKSNVCAVMPDYPLGPKNNVQNSLPILMKMYEETIKKADGKEIIVMGDSAGGALSILLANHAKEYGLKSPEQLILISPAVDLSFENPDLKIMDKRSTFLSLKGVKRLPEYWGKDLDPKNPLLSPLYSDVTSLPKTSIFLAGLEIFLPDGLRFADKLKENNKSFKIYYYPMMWHAWTGLYSDMAEDKDTVKKICEIIN